MVDKISMYYKGIVHDNLNCDIQYAYTKTKKIYCLVTEDLSLFKLT